MNSHSQSEEHILTILEGDRIWSAYAIADLDPQYKPSTVWFANQDAVVLIYKGLKPPVLFSFGHIDRLEFLFQQIPLGDYFFSLLPSSRKLMDDRMTVNFETEMWRMSLDPQRFNPVPDEAVSRLGVVDINDMVELFAQHPDRPDSFSPTQVKEGVYFGVRVDTELISIAGTHVLSMEQSVAAVGNVFTRPDHRNKGYGTSANCSVTKALIDMGIRTIVLNVATANQPAIRSYTRIGFEPYRKYQEGLGTVTVTPSP